MPTSSLPRHNPSRARGRSWRGAIVAVATDAASLPEGVGQSLLPALPCDQEADHHQVGEVEGHTNTESRRIEAIVVVELPREPTAECHAAHAEKEECRHAP